MEVGDEKRGETMHNRLLPTLQRIGPLAATSKIVSELPRLLREWKVRGDTLDVLAALGPVAASDEVREILPHLLLDYNFMVRASAAKAAASLGVKVPILMRVRKWLKDSAGQGNTYGGW